MKRNAEKNPVIKRVWLITWRTIVWIVFGVMIMLFGGLDFIGSYQQSSSSTFVRVTNVKLASFDWDGNDTHGTGDYTVKVNFTYRGHQYKKVEVADSKSLGFVKYADSTIWVQRGYNCDKYTGDASIDTSLVPPLKNLLTYNHEKRISKDTYAVQVNRWTPSLKNQLHDNEVCLVTNQ